MVVAERNDDIESSVPLRTESLSNEIIPDNELEDVNDNAEENFQSKKPSNELKPTDHDELQQIASTSKKKKVAFKLPTAGKPPLPLRRSPRLQKKEIAVQDPSKSILQQNENNNSDNEQV